MKIHMMTTMMIMSTTRARWLAAFLTLLLLSLSFDIVDSSATAAPFTTQRVLRWLPRPGSTVLTASSTSPARQSIIPALRIKRREKESSAINSSRAVVSTSLKAIRTKAGNFIANAGSGPGLSNCGFYFGFGSDMLRKNCGGSTSLIASNTNADGTLAAPMKEASLQDAMQELRTMKSELSTLRRQVVTLRRKLGEDVPDIEEEDGFGEASGGLSTIMAKRKRQRQFDLIAADVEKWAKDILRNHEGWKEISGWNMYNTDGRTKCYLKWMKDSRGDNANKSDDNFYPCLKIYSTVDASLEDVCAYLAEPDRLPEYNDLVVQVRVSVCDRQWCCYHPVVEHVVVVVASTVHLKRSSCRLGSLCCSIVTWRRFHRTPRFAGARPHKSCLSSRGTLLRSVTTDGGRTVPRSLSTRPVNTRMHRDSLRKAKAVHAGPMPFGELTVSMSSCIVRWVWRHVCFVHQTKGTNKDKLGLYPCSPILACLLFLSMPPFIACARLVISRHPDDPNKTQFMLVTHANPGGGLPRWVSAVVACRSPTTSLLPTMDFCSLACMLVRPLSPILTRIRTDKRSFVSCSFIAF